MLFSLLSCLATQVAVLRTILLYSFWELMPCTKMLSQIRSKGQAPVVLHSYSHYHGKLLLLKGKETFTENCSNTSDILFLSLSFSFYLRKTHSSVENKTIFDFSVSLIMSLLLWFLRISGFSEACQQAINAQYPRPCS